VRHQHLNYMQVLPSGEDSARTPTGTELALVLESLLASRALLAEDAAVRKGECERRVVLNLEMGEVERVLGEVGGARWKSVLSV
jgi:origin recognition complex subunit 1